MTPNRITSCTNCGRRNRVPATASGTPRCGQCRTALPWVADAGDADFVQVAEQSPLPVLVDLWATWCGPCRMVSPVLERLAAAFAGRVKLVRVDVDTAPGLARRFEVQAVPTLLVLDRGAVVARQAGAAPEATLRAWLEGALASRIRG